MFKTYNILKINQNDMNMSENERDLQKEIIRQIKDSRWSIKEYFKDLFKQLLPTELLQNQRIRVIDDLITDTLPEILSNHYDHDGYVLMFYAHQTHTQIVSPFNSDTNPSHTSLLLCKVDGGRINQVLNIDGYHNLDFMDIIGERPGAKANPYIRHRLLIDAPDKPNSGSRPLQSASWHNLNCPLYAFAFAKAILNAFSLNQHVLDDLFIEHGISQPALSNLQNKILQGVDGIYVNYNNGNYYRNSEAATKFHTNTREILAQTVQARFDQQVRKESVDTAHITERKPPVSVTSSSLFKPNTDNASKAVNKLTETCTAYQTHLYTELQKRTGQNWDEIAGLVKSHVIGTGESNDLDEIIKKCIIVNSMFNVLQNHKEGDGWKRINSMKAILTPANKAILTEHRSAGGKFLQSILNVLSAIASVISKQEWEYKSKGGQLLDTIETAQAHTICYNFD
jgi:hypothetical protein